MKFVHLLAYILIVLLIALRFINLINIPIFGDESLYINFAYNIIDNPSAHFFDSIPFGVFPIFIWIQAIFHKTFFQFLNPLLLSRIIAVIVDLISATFIFKLGKLLYNKTFAVISLLIYLTLPLTFFNSRLALLESTTHLFVIIAMYLSVLAIKKKLLLKQINYRWIVSLAMFLTLSFFTKPLAVIIFIPIFLIPVFSKINLNRKNKFIWVNYLISLFLTGLLISFFYLPDKHYFSKFIFENKILSIQTVTFFFSNLRKALSWLKIYLSLPLLILSIIAIMSSAFKKDSILIWLSLWFILGLLLSSFLGAYFFPRHLFLLSSPATFLISYIIQKLTKRRLLINWVLLIIILIPALSLLYQITFNPSSANIAGEDKQQLYQNWNSGVGLKELSHKLQILSDQQKITVWIENDPSLTWPLKHLYPTGNTELIPFDTFPQELSTNRPTYLILALETKLPPDYQLTSIVSYSRGPRYSIDLYQFQPKVF